MAAEKKRNLGIDILCCVGAVMLLTLQYFEAIGFMEAPVESWASAVPVAVRWLSLSGAALLSAGTGYVLSTKKFTMGYFRILIRLVYVYLVCSLLALGMRVVLLGDVLAGEEALQSILNFSPTDTGRFAGMYFALLIAAPYLNACFHGLGERKARQSLLAILMLTAGLQPMLFASDIHLLPEWCKGLFPAAAYIGGAYIRKYGKRRKIVVWLPTLIALLIAETTVVMLVSLPGGVLYCPWLDSLAALPSIGVALMLLSLLHSSKPGTGSVHRFFAGAAGGVISALLLGDLIVDASLPAVIERFPTLEGQLIAGIFVVPVIFVISCVLGLLLQMPLFGVRAYLRSEEAETEEGPPVPEKPRPEESKKLRKSVHTIKVPVSEPDVDVRLTQPKAEEKPQGIHEIHLPEQPEPQKAYEPVPEPEDTAEVKVYKPRKQAAAPEPSDVKVYVPKHAKEPARSSGLSSHTVRDLLTRLEIEEGERNETTHDR